MSFHYDFDSDRIWDVSDLDQICFTIWIDILLTFLVKVLERSSISWRGLRKIVAQRITIFFVNWKSNSANLKYKLWWLSGMRASRMPVGQYEHGTVMDGRHSSTRPASPALLLSLVGAVPCTVALPVLKMRYDIVECTRVMYWRSVNALWYCGMYLRCWPFLQYC